MHKRHSKSMDYIETERLILRHFTEKDVNALFTDPE